MSKKFIIGDRLKDEWISVLDTEKKKLEFTNHLATAKEYLKEEEAKENLHRLFQRPADLYEGRQQGLQNRRARLLPVVKRQEIPANRLGFLVSITSVRGRSHASSWRRTST